METFEELQKELIKVCRFDSPSDEEVFEYEDRIKNIERTLTDDQKSNLWALIEELSPDLDAEDWFGDD